MKARNANLKLSILSLAMIGVFSSMYAYADEEEAAALMNPTSSVTVEEIYVSQGSQKFGEYNGLNKQGGYLNGNINIRGGDAYKRNEEGDTTRWSVTGTNLGLSNRSATAGYSDQGNWSVGIGYDALQHNLAPGYQTPYQGSMGGNSFTLPAGSGFPMSISSPGTTSLTSTQRAAFQNVDISSTRQNSSLSITKELDSGFSLAIDYNHLDQSGAKPMAFASAALTGSTSSGISILPNPTNYQTDTLNLAANWRGEKAHLTGSYFGSFFRDGYNGVNWQSFAGTATSIQTMSTAPSNQLQQLNFGGGYDFSAKTKLAGNLSYGRNTQTAATQFDSGMIVGGVAPSFKGLVNTAHADVKLTDQSIKDLALSAGFKFDSRDNLSQSQIQQLYSIDITHPTMYPNTPLSYRKSQFDIGGEYKIDKVQRAGLNYQNLNINRFCNQYAVGPSSTPGANGYYPAGTDCVQANNDRSNIFDAYYKLKAVDTVNVKVSYTYDSRKASMNQDAIAAFVGKNNTLVNAGQNGGDYVGYQPYFEASRNQQSVKGRVAWDATEVLSTGLTGKYSYATYPDSTYGVQNGTTWSVSWDGAFQYAEEGSVTAYAVQQNTQRNLSNYYYSTSTTSGGNGAWNNNLQGHDTTFGLGLKHGGLMSGKVNLYGDLTYSLGQTFYNTTPGSFVSTATSVSTSNLNYANGSFGSPPAIRNDLIALKFGGFYQIDKRSKVGVQYLYQRLVANDPYYVAYSYGTTGVGMLPSNQTSGGYNVNVIAASYTYSFD